MKKTKRAQDRKYFTLAEANATLPLVSVIVRDITELAHSLRDRQERLARMECKEKSALGKAYDEELDHIQAEFDRDRERMGEYLHELSKLGIELKDFFSGLIDFPCLMDDREVYLCWKLGEPEVAHWHELDAGFSGRQEISVATGVR